jgi:regulator of cell morphogenesis and NO signaling
MIRYQEHNMNYSDTTLAALVTADPGAARVLEQHSLDYCCGGQRTLGSACTAAGVDPDEVMRALSALDDEPEVEWTSMGPGALVDHLEITHHRYLRHELPRLSDLVAKVEAVHGERHPELSDVRLVFDELRVDLEPHLMKEERILFPMIRELESPDTAPSFHCGTLANPIRVMCGEHDLVGALLARLRQLTGGYEVPADGCASYRALYDSLAQLEADTHMHVHKENNVLFPAVIELEVAASR